MAGFDPTFTASGSSHRGGSVPDPGGTAGTTKFLREDAIWVIPGSGGAVEVTDGTTTVSAATEISFSGATVTDAGGGVADVAILVPVPWAVEHTASGGFSFTITTDMQAAARHIRICGQVRSSSTSGTTGKAWHMTLNGQTSGYVFYETLLVPGNTPAYNSNTGQAAIPLGGGETGGIAGFGGLPTDSDADHLLSFVIDIPYAFSSAAKKSVLYNAMSAGNAGQNAVQVQGQANSVSGAISSLAFAIDDASAFHSASSIIVYGIA